MHVPRRSSADAEAQERARRLGPRQALLLAFRYCQAGRVFDCWCKALMVIDGKPVCVKHARLLLDELEQTAA